MLFQKRMFFQSKSEHGLKIRRKRRPGCFKAGRIQTSVCFPFSFNAILADGDDDDGGDDDDDDDDGNDDDDDEEKEEEDGVVVVAVFVEVFSLGMGDVTEFFPHQTTPP